MTKAFINYRRLPGDRKAPIPFFGSRCWLASDHLLHADIDGITEKYKRFYFCDIQALVIRQTPRRIYWSLAFLAHAGFWGLITVADGYFSSISVVFLLFSFLMLSVNIRMGPTCVGYLRTAAQETKLTSLRRLKGARLAQEALRAEIEKAQGLLDHNLTAQQEPEPPTTQAE